MPLYAPKKETSYEPVPAGTHLATCYQVIHIGTVEGSWQGKPTQRDIVRVTFELPDETRVFKEEDGAKPMVISREFTLSMSPKGNLKPFVGGMYGVAFKEEEAFDLFEMVGKSCILTVVHANVDDKTYANISSASPLMKGMKKPEQVNPSVTFDINDFNQEVFNELPEFLRKKIEATPEYQNRLNKVAEQNDGIPF